MQGKFVCRSCSHTRKSARRNQHDVDDWRGASPQLGAVRIARTFNL